VAIDGDNSLDSILSETGIPENFDLLSIDIDGDDYHIWRTLKKFKPKVVIIEHNPSIPPNMELVDIPNAREFGASALSLLKLAETIGYSLVTCTKTNMIFIKTALFKSLEIDPVRLEDVFKNDHLKYLIGSYKGRVFMSKSAKEGHISTRGALTLRSFLPSEIPSESNEKITPVFLCEISKLKNNKLFACLIKVMWGCFGVFRRKK
jgi:hypothetical protein